MFSPKPRYRFYGTPNNYLTAARHAVASALSRQEGPDHLAMLSRRVAAMVGVEHAIPVPQARFGIYLALRNLIKPGDKVLLSPYTIHDVVNMVICAGGEPVFCDIERETCNIDPAEIERHLVGGIGAVMITHLHGLACDIDAISAMCAKAGVPLVEDAAQALGARVDGSMVGGVGDVGIFSFGRAKNINGFYGGVVTTHDKALAAAIERDLSELPPEDPGKLARRIAHCLIGDLMTLPAIFSPLTFRLFKLGALNDVKAVNRLVQTEAEPVFRDQVPEAYFRQMSPMQARVIYEQLFSIDDLSAIRIDYAQRYHRGLSDCKGVMLPPLRLDGSHIYLQYPIQVEERWDFVRYMMRNGRDVAIQHMGSAADLEIFSEYRRDCPNARATAEQCVILPTYPGYGADEVEANIAVMRGYFR